MTWWEQTLKIWRVFVLGLGAFDVGFAIMIAWMFMRGKFKFGTYRDPGHVIPITISYILLGLGVWVAIFGKALAGADVTWRLPLATVAYPLGIIGLYRLLKRRSRAG